MVHIMIYDDIHLTDLKELNKDTPNKLYALQVSVNAHSDVLDNNKDRALHRLLRFEEFCCFNKKVKSIVGQVDELYLKYGGLCFLWFNNIERYREVEDNIKFLFQHDYIVDEFNNNLLLERPATPAVIDKFIIRQTFLERDLDLLYYRPTEMILNKSKEEVISIIKDMKSIDIKTSQYFTDIRN